MPADSSAEIAKDLRNIKHRHGFPNHFETKWTKVSPGAQAFYQEQIDYFFDNPKLHFRTLIAPKAGLDHARFGQDHDTWYYKMYYQLLKHLIHTEASFRIYLDVKDSKSSSKQRTLHDVLCNRMRDSDRKIVERVQSVPSKEVEQVQLADFLTGIMSHHNRQIGIGGSRAKAALIQSFREKLGRSLEQSTPYSMDKVSILHWQPQVNQNG